MNGPCGRGGVSRETPSPYGLDLSTLLPKPLPEGRGNVCMLDLSAVMVRENECNENRCNAPDEFHNLCIIAALLGGWAIQVDKKGLKPLVETKRI